MKREYKDIIGRSYFHIEDGEEKHWGKVLDYKPAHDKFVVYNGYNPIGHKMRFEDAGALIRWEREGKIKQK